MNRWTTLGAIACMSAGMTACGQPAPLPAVAAGPSAPGASSAPGGPKTPAAARSTAGISCVTQAKPEVGDAIAQVMAVREAAWEGNQERVRACLQEGVDPNLAWPGAARHATIAKLVLDAGAKPDGPPENTCPDCAAAGLAVAARPLCDAARHGTAEVVRLLVRAGADVALPDSGAAKMAPVHLAAQRHAPEILRVLLEARADANATDGEGRTALMLAVQTHSDNLDETVRALVRGGADPARRDREGRIASDIARECLGDSAANLASLLKP